MLSYYVDEDAFLKGVSVYLKARLYGNSVTADLWNGIAEVTGISPCSHYGTEAHVMYTGIDVGRFMDHWISKVTPRSGCGLEKTAEVIRLVSLS